MTPLEELKRLMERATPQPWMNNDHYKCIHTHNEKVGLCPVVHYSSNNPNAARDAELIAAAVNALQALLAVAQAAVARSDFYRHKAEHLTEVELISGELDHDIALEEALVPFLSPTDRKDDR